MNTFSLVNIPKGGGRKNLSMCLNKEVLGRIYFDVY
jgi:hypothetical protein